MAVQGCQMSNAELLQYKRYLQKYVFAGWEASDDLKEWVRLLERHIMHSDLQQEEGWQRLLDSQPESSGVQADQSRPDGTTQSLAWLIVLKQLRRKVTNLHVCCPWVSHAEQVNVGVWPSAPIWV